MEFPTSSEKADDKEFNSKTPRQHVDLEPYCRASSLQSSSESEITKETNLSFPSRISNENSNFEVFQVKSNIDLRQSAIVTARGKKLNLEAMKTTLGSREL